MSETDPTCLAYLTYFMTERFYRKAITTADEHLRVYNNDPVLLFFKAYGKLMEGRTQEAIRELELVKHKQSVSICSALALICAHKQCDIVDRGAVLELESHVKTIRKTAGENTLYYGGMFLWLIGHTDKAKDYIDKIPKTSKYSKEGSILKGWIDMSAVDDVQNNNAIRYLNEGVQDSKNIFGMMGKVKYFMKKQNYTGSLKIANQIMSIHPDFLPGLLMKLKLFLALVNWDQALETTQRIKQLDKLNLSAIQAIAIHSIVNDGDLIKTKEHLLALLNATEISEPCSPNLKVNLTQPISRMCGGNPEILQLLIPFVERVFVKAPADADIANELGYLLTLQGKAKEAARWFSVALNVDTNSVIAIAGLIRCQLIDGNLKEAAEQLEFLKEIQQSINQLGELALLEAILAHSKGAGLDVVSPLLKKAAELHFLELRGRPLGPEYFHLLNPNFIFQMVNLHLSYFQDQPLAVGQTLPFGLSHSMMILEPVVKTAPGLLPGAYHLAKAKYLAGDIASAQKLLDLCLEKDPTIAEVHLLQAKVYLHEKDFTACFQSLEMGVSHNFQVRELPQYHLIKARALRASGNLEGAIQSLKMAMSLPGVKRVVKDRETVVKNSERVSVYLELADALIVHGEQHEATMVMQEAIVNFRHSPEEIRVMLGNVDLALAKGDLDAAINILRTITPDQPHYTEARQKMAAIYLQQRKDKKLYIACYREIQDSLPGLHSSILLGDAYMKIQQPQRAIEVYEEAMSKKFRDPTLSRKLGEAFLKTHQYQQAVIHYENAMKLGGQDSLFVDYAELLLKLKLFSKAQRVLAVALHTEDGASLSTIMSNVKCLLLLAKAYYGNEGSTLETLEKAYEVHMKVLMRVQIEQPGLYDQQREVTASICRDLARIHRRQREFAKAQAHYMQALSHCGCDKYTVEFAQFYLESGRLNEAETQCAEVLRKDPDHGGARKVLGDIRIRQNQIEDSLTIYEMLVNDFPDNYEYMLGCIQKHRWRGTLSCVQTIFDSMESRKQSAPPEPGYYYCKGLYYWYTCNVSEALLNLNKARRDTEWGEQTLELMIRICLNPDNETTGGEVFETAQDEWSPAGTAEPADQVGVATARNLLREFRPRSPESLDRAKLLGNLCLMATRESKQVEKALLYFTEMAANKTDNLAYLLAMGQAFVMLKQTPRARNQLKRLSKMAWREEQADDLEMAWLLLADIYIKSGKYGLASDLLRRCIKHNQSCSRSYEYLGFMSENEQCYKDASELYEQAWMHSGKVNPGIGFRLAFNYLKSKSYTKAIDICHKVLEEHPDYPVIKTEILARAQSLLRP